MATNPGHYDIVSLLPGDNTFARGSLYVLKPGTKLVLFDVDGTITVGDQEVRCLRMF
jgi:phosphatidate phosphatase PAH1